MTSPASGPDGGQQRRKRSLSGIKPTGNPHIGNYLGMIRPAIALQDTHDAFYFVADYHALTTMRSADEMRRHSHEITAIFLACGLDRERATFFRQSDVPEVLELSWVLSCVTHMGLLERAHAYKAARDKGEEKQLPVGTFAYPVLMAADILLYDSDVVPVGSDQLQHVEMAQDMAGYFNQAFGDTLRRPEPLVRSEVATVPGVDGRKMSKSYGNELQLFSEPGKLKKRVMSIKTDSTPVEAPKNPDADNVFAIYKLFARPDESTALAERYRAGGMGYGDAKKLLFEVLERELGPLRARYDELMSRPDELESFLAEGAARARRVAVPVLDRVRNRVGFPRLIA
jgi:tryptophanyl-tRNA synthetase